MSVRLFVLGILNKQNACGYDLKEISRKWAISDWSNIGSGSLYHALSQMCKEELINELSIEQEGKRPQKTIYSITVKGREYFMELLKDTFENVYLDKDPLDIAFAFTDNLTNEEIIKLFKYRIEKLKQYKSYCDQKLELMKKPDSEFKWSVPCLERGIIRFDDEIKWSEKFIEDLSANSKLGI